jgi:DNA repair protein RadD
MILRPRQKDFVDAVMLAFETKDNTLGVAPTGAGKTVILSSIMGHFDTSLILQHRDELVTQNLRTFKAVNPKKHADIFTADRKRFLGVGATFAMLQTMCRPANLDRMKPVDAIAIDEAHHAVSVSYKKVIERARELNPKVKILGVTATPSRSDRKALAEMFDNVADVIQLGELIQAGLLVRPRTFVVDCGLQEELSHVRRTAQDFDMKEVEKVMDKMAVNARVFDEWKTLAGNRLTVIFTSTVAHAEHVCKTFQEKGVLCEVVHGEMPDGLRKDLLARYDRGEVQVVVNVAVLTEGWDCQPVSCVILLRPCSHKSTVLQMIGRGLRKVEPERYPWAVKDDCIVIDFGYSLITNGNLDIEIDLNPVKREKKTICCPGCGAPIPASVTNCPLCEFLFNDRAAVVRAARERGALEEFGLTEIELLDLSPYKWETMFGDLVMIANGLTAWAACVLIHGRWRSIGWHEGSETGALELANNKDRILALGAADDYLRQHGDQTNAKKTKSWLNLPATEEQGKMLKLDIMQTFALSRYRASCMLTWRFHEKIIRKKLLGHAK